METRASYVAAGTFVIGLMVGLVFFVIWINRIDWSEGKKYDVYFSGSVTGLRTNESVTYNGVPIGRVDSISIDPLKLNVIKVTLEIDNPEIIRENSYATLEAKGITGTVQVRIHGSTTDSPCLRVGPGETHPVIKSQVSSFQAVIDEAPILLEKIATLLEEIRPMFREENRLAFSKSMQNLEKLTTTLVSQTEDMKDIFNVAQKAFASIDNSGKQFQEAMQQFNLFMAENRPHIYQFTSKGLRSSGVLLNKLSSLATSVDNFAQRLDPHPLEYILQSSDQGEVYPE